jgi:hypothetical protein
MKTEENYEAFLRMVCSEMLEDSYEMKQVTVYNYSILLYGFWVPFSAGGDFVGRFSLLTCLPRQMLQWCIETGDGNMPHNYLLSIHRNLPASLTVI